MRLIGKLERLERRKEREAMTAAGIVWTQDEERLEVELAPGEHLAVDVEILEAATEANPAQWRTRERATRDPRDFGKVTQNGREVGRVARVRGSLIELALTAA
ncbi:MAG: hypothetical protein HXY23_14570, partial [Parvularculaceae bacterium]|nr:hypothetical protein [Parvularculaceae bacterium]